jgi:hypothetical protein
VIRLHAHGEDAALAERIAAAGDVPDLAGDKDQVLVAHQLRSRGGDFRRDDRGEIVQRRLVAFEQQLAELADRQPRQALFETGTVERITDESRHVVGVVIDHGVVDDFAERHVGQGEFGGDALAFGRRGNSGQLIARFFLVCLGEQVAQVGKSEPLRADGGVIGHN